MRDSFFQQNRKIISAAFLFVLFCVFWFFMVNQPPKLINYLGEGMSDERAENAVKSFRKQIKSLGFLDNHSLSNKGAECKTGHIYVLTTPFCDECKEIAQIVSDSEETPLITYVLTSDSRETADINAKILCSPEPYETYLKVLNNSLSLDYLSSCDIKALTIAEDQVKINKFAEDLGIKSYPVIFISYKNGDVVFEEGLSPRVKNALKGVPITAKQYEKADWE
jgi:hypothetical protein